jgi:carbamoylphosphate synthase large subunit
MNSLVILGGTVTALGVLREARRLGFSCTVFDTRAGVAMRSRYARAVLMREHEDRALVSALVGLGAKQCALIATEDRWLEFVRTHRAVLEASYGAVLAASNEALRICLDKAAFARWCEEQKLPACRSWSLDRLAEVRLPALIRPASTLHGRPTSVCPKRSSSNRSAH